MVARSVFAISSRGWVQPMWCAGGAAVDPAVYSGLAVCRHCNAAAAAANLWHCGSRGLQAGSGQLLPRLQLTHAAAAAVTQLCQCPQAALEFLLRSGRQPDILHCHDWSSADVARAYWTEYHSYGLWKPNVVSWHGHWFSEEGRRMRCCWRGWERLWTSPLPACLAVAPDALSLLPPPRATVFYFPTNSFLLYCLPTPRPHAGVHHPQHGLWAAEAGRGGPPLAALHHSVALLCL